MFALTQIGIGLALLYRRTATIALAVSLVWALIVWWLGEAFGMLFMNTASALTGAPGAVVLYALIALVVWPNDRAGGLLGDRGTRMLWAGVWFAMAWLWLLPANSGDNSVSNTIAAVPSGAAWLGASLSGVAQITQGTRAGHRAGLRWAVCCDRLRRRIPLASKDFSVDLDRPEPDLLGDWSRLRRYRHRGSHRCQQRPAVHPACLRPVHVVPHTATISRRVG
ncbi:MAG TPA: hypothetical protein VGN81_36000 [Pseudonocardiaceae bacterium]